MTGGVIGHFPDFLRSKPGYIWLLLSGGKISKNAETWHGFSKTWRSPGLMGGQSGPE